MRTADQLLVFSGYSGPDPNADSGVGADGGADVNLIYWQAFDPTTGKSLGAAQALALADSTSLGTIYLDDVSIAPTGEIALLYTHLAPDTPIDSPATIATGLTAAFLAPTADAGSTGPQVRQAVPIESAEVGNPDLSSLSPIATQGQPHAIWSTTSGAFVFSYVVFNTPDTYPYAVVRKYLPTGAPAGGDSDPVPTFSYNGQTADVSYESASVGTSGSLFGVAFSSGGSSNGEFLTVLDGMGNQVGQTIFVSESGTSASLVGYDDAPGGYYWVSVAGTAQGFVYFIDGATCPPPNANAANAISEVFVPIAADGGLGDAGNYTSCSSNCGCAATLPDGGSLPGFVLSQPAVIGRAISDDTGGAGGVGTVLLYPDGAYFLYVNADGVTHTNQINVIPHQIHAGDEVAITEFGGSFGVSLYSSAENLTRMLASGCQ